MRYFLPNFLKFFAMSESLFSMFIILKCTKECLVCNGVLWDILMLSLTATSNWLASLTHYSRWPLGPTWRKICSMHTRLSTVNSVPLWSKTLSSNHHSQHYQGPKKESLLFNTCILWEADLWCHLYESVASN